mgnify:CR=1 FL=1
MVPVLDRRLSLPSFSRPVNWLGRSGRFYALSAEPLDSFSLRPGELYLIARGALVLWVGSSADVVDDPQSRARFRLAIATADRVFHVEAGEDDVERMTIVWDLEGAAPVSGLHAA